MLLKRLFNEILSEVVHHSKVKGQKLYTYDELSDEAKRVAGEEVIRSFKFAHEDQISTAKQDFKSNMNRAVDDEYHIKRIKNAKDNLDKITRDQKYLKSVIEQNNLRFLEDGTYVTYFLDYGNRK